MATNIPPHNLGEVIDACLAYMDNGAITTEELIEIVPGPDFPTGGDHPRPRRRALGLRDRARLDHRPLAPRGRGRPRRPPLDRPDRDPVPAGQERAGREDRRGRQGEAGRGRQRHPRRIEPRGRAHRHRPEARRDASRSCSTSCGGTRPAQGSFPANMLAIRGGRPELLNLRDIIAAFVNFREEVITRRSKFELAKARDRAHILLGLVIAVTNLDEVVRIIRGSPRPPTARDALDGARMADRRDRALHPPGRGGRGRDQRRHLSPVRDAGPRDPRPAPPPPDRARPRRDRRRAGRRWPARSPSCSRSSPTAPSSTR